MTITKNGGPLKLTYTPMQETVFSDPHRYVVLAKGRRVGGTMGAVIHTIEQLIDGKKFLWVDTIQANLGRYYERYFTPILSQIENKYYDWNEQKKTLKLLNGWMDMRSAERPENIEGFAYNTIICNESGIIFNANKYLWNNALRPMCLDYKAKVFFIGTPKGKRDKNGEEALYWDFYKRGLDRDPSNVWASYKYTSYDNPLLDPGEIKDLENEVPSHIQRQEIHGEFIDITEDQIFKETWWRYDANEPRKEDVQLKILALDTAYKEKDSNDYTAGGTWYRTSMRYQCMDVFNERLAFPDLIDKVLKMHERYNYDVIVVEDKASGQSLIQMLQRTTLPVVPFKVDTDKVTRAISVTPLIEQGKVFLTTAGWNKSYTDQLAMFPQAEFDDMVDMTSMALQYLKNPLYEKIRVPISKTIVRSSDNLRGY